MMPHKALQANVIISNIRDCHTAKSLGQTELVNLGKVFSVKRKSEFLPYMRQRVNLKLNSKL